MTTVFHKRPKIDTFLWIGLQLSSHHVLLTDGAGNIYGTTYGDGSKTSGSVFEITP